VTTSAPSEFSEGDLRFDSVTDAPELWQRFLVILLDGMRQHRAAPSPLPYGPLDAARDAATTGNGRRQPPRVVR